MAVVLNGKAVPCSRKTAAAIQTAQASARAWPWARDPARTHAAYTVATQALLLEGALVAAADCMLEHAVYLASTHHGFASDCVAVTLQAVTILVRECSVDVVAASLSPERLKHFDAIGVGQQVGDLLTECQTGEDAPHDCVAAVLRAAVGLCPLRADTLATRTDRWLRLALHTRQWEWCESAALDWVFSGGGGGLETLTTELLQCALVLALPRGADEAALIRRWAVRGLAFDAAALAHVAAHTKRGDWDALAAYAKDKRSPMLGALVACP